MNPKRQPFCAHAGEPRAAAKGVPRGVQPGIRAFADVLHFHRVADDSQHHRDPRRQGIEHPGVRMVGRSFEHGSDHMVGPGAQVDHNGQEEVPGRKEGRVDGWKERKAGY